MAATPQSSLSLIGFDVSTAAIMSETPSRPQEQKGMLSRSSSRTSSKPRPRNQGRRQIAPGHSYACYGTGFRNRGGLDAFTLSDNIFREI